MSDDTNPLPIAHVNPAYHTSPPTEISLSYFYLCYKTNKFNSFFETLAKRTPRFWKVWFNVGVLVGILAMILGVGIMMIAGWKLLMGMMESFGFDFRNHEELSSYPLQTGLAKRNLEEIHKVEPDNDHQVFIPVIPGVTLPISHLLYYLVALLLCGILHEAGHAIAAYCESVSLNNVGIFLYFLYPGAFVTFSDQDFDKCPSVKKLRILCAGVWHNVVVFLLGTLLLNSGTLTLSMNLIGYRSVEGTGVSVIGVEENTGLAGILYPSTLITRLDDYELNDASLEKWESYLLQDDKLIKDEHGFCASENDITPSLNCCDIDTVHPYGKSENKEISCFQRFDQNNSRNQELSCLYVKPILINVKEQRCKKGSDCDNPSPMCVIPYTLPGFPRPVRIYFKYPSWIENQDESQVQVLLWLGDLKDLWEIIQVSILQPRWSWIPLWIPFTIELIIRYTVSFSLALCILNIIPAFQLDGHHALTTMLVWLFEIDAMGNREGTSTAISISKRRRQRKKIENGIVYGVTGLVGWVVLGTLISGVIF